MAREFKSHGVVLTETTYTDIPIGAVPANREWIVMNCRVSNIHASASYKVAVRVVKDSANVRSGATNIPIVQGLQIPAGNALDVFDDDQKFVLEAGDKLQAYSETGASTNLVLFMSFRERTTG